MLLRELLTRIPRQSAGRDELRGKSVVLGQMMIENRNIELEIPIALEDEDIFAQEIVILRRAVGGEAHDLPLFALEHVEAEIVRDSGVKLAQRVRKLYFGYIPDPPVALAVRQHRRCRLTGAVYGEDRRGGERRRIEGTGRVTVVVGYVVKIEIAFTERLANVRGDGKHPEVFFHPWNAAVHPRCE